MTRLEPENLDLLPVVLPAILSHISIEKERNPTAGKIIRAGYRLGKPFDFADPITMFFNLGPSVGQSRRKGGQISFQMEIATGPGVRDKILS